MLNKKIYLAIQAFFVSIITPFLNILCSLHKWIEEYKVIFPAISVFISYYVAVFICRFITLKSLEEVRVERAQKLMLKEIKKQLKMDISESRKQELISFRDEILTERINMQKMFLEACKEDFKKSLDE
ncbi:hypothetical protein GYM75_06330 [Gilliamella sp. ESL0441]|uniref:hypothetical protein n=1 Tax=Gilliamella sp. ESL0441 TaxID=2704654 RepID=UPI001C69C163|nr:hypothetical protein [Gilliamella sp. ESL0441]QYN44485.1 hypothetical protein GYM75_06330 [Gilliamella sp. ESL0441]